MIHSWDAGGFAAASWSTLTARMVFGSVIHHPFVQILRLHTERKIKTCNVLHVKLVNTPLKKKKKNGCSLQLVPVLVCEHAEDGELAAVTSVPI